MADYRSSVRYLKAADPVLAKVISAVGPCRIQIRAEGSHFQALARSIVFQQLSGKAASTIHARFNALCPGGEASPEAVLAASDAELRSAGLSRQKMGYARSLSEQVTSGALDLAALPADDEEAIAALTRIKGIGRWSAEIYLLFAEGRPDIFPAGDLAVQAGMGRILGLEERPSEKHIREASETWRPHRGAVTLLTWHCYNNAAL